MRDKIERVEIVLCGLIICIMVGVFFGYKAGLICFLFAEWILMLFSYYFDKKETMKQPPTPELSNWRMNFFGTDDLVWKPAKVPNWWVRFWSKVFFNCRWIKEGK